jgi:hypothetical protein
VPGTMQCIERALSKTEVSRCLLIAARLNDINVVDSDRVQCLWEVHMAKNLDTKMVCEKVSVCASGLLEFHR